MDKEVECKTKMFKDDFDVIYTILGFWLVMWPLVCSFFALFGVDFNISVQLLTIVVVFSIIKLTQLIINFRKLTIKRPGIISILIWCMVGLIIATSVINRKVDSELIYLLSLFMLVSIFNSINPKFFKRIIHVFIYTILLCVIMGFCDIRNTYMPGFQFNWMELSMQFGNPNYSAVVVLSALILTLNLFLKETKSWRYCIYLGIITIFDVFIFLNGSYVAEFGLWLVLLFYTIYLWVKNKKFPVKLIPIYVITLACGFIYVDGISTSEANFYLESISLFDSIFGTKLLKPIVNKDSIPGVTGWDRENLWVQSIQQICSSVKNFIIGGGAGARLSLGSHNTYLAIWLDGGILSLGLFISIIVFVCIKFFKSKNKAKNINLCVMFVAWLYFGCFSAILVYIHVYCIIMAVMFYRSMQFDGTNKGKE